MEIVTITTQTMPSHTHPLMASTDGADKITGAGGVLAAPPSLAPYYSSPPDATALNPAALAPAGGSQPHNNMQPFLAISFIISLFGIFPSPT